MTSFLRFASRAAIALSLFATATLTFGQDGATPGSCAFQRLIIPGPAGSKPAPNAINNAGAIVGAYFDSQSSEHGFLFSNGKFASFKFPGSKNSSASDINNHGQIIGSFDAFNGNGQRAFTVLNGSFRQIAIPGFPDAPAVGTGVNDNGDLVGGFNKVGTNVGFRIRAGRLTTLSFPGATGGTTATSINNSGIIIGTYKQFQDDDPNNRGFSWNNGTFSNIDFPGAVSTSPEKVSSLGDIVGTYVDVHGISHGFALDKGKFTTINAPNSSTMGTAVTGVNIFDTVVGGTFTGGFGTFRANCRKQF
jgi:probable HAF family extracellular repeat protein